MSVKTHGFLEFTSTIRLDFNSKMRGGMSEVNHNQFIYKGDKKMLLRDFSPDFTADFNDEQQARASMQKDAADIAKFQDILMAHETHGLLVIFQAMDGAAKTRPSRT